MGLSNGTDCSALPVSRVLEEPYGIYPGVESFSRDYGVEDYREWVEESNGDPVPAPLALYIQDIGKQQGSDGSKPPLPSHRLSAIGKELALLGQIFDADRPVQQFICSGDIANRWSDDQLYELVSLVQDSFHINHGGAASWCACAGECIPPVERLRLLRVLGFTSVRFSLTQNNAEQHALQTLRDAVRSARDLGFVNVVLDIMPSETGAVAPVDRVESFVDDVKPERIRLLANHDDSCHPYTELLTQLLISLGYQNIGMDWFLQPQDQWLRAKAEGRLYWSLLGFTEMSHPDVIGVGPGAISSVGFFYSINEVAWEHYRAILARGELPVSAGIELESDDMLRREIMGMILAGSCIRVAAIEEKWGIKFRQFFAWEADRLQRLAQKQWLDWRGDKIAIRVRGSEELIELCRVFDRRRRQENVLPELSLV